MELVLISVYSVVPLVTNLRAGPLQRVTLIDGLENKETIYDRVISLDFSPDYLISSVFKHLIKLNHLKKEKSLINNSEWGQPLHMSEFDMILKK